MSILGTFIISLSFFNNYELHETAFRNCVTRLTGIIVMALIKKKFEKCRKHPKLHKTPDNDIPAENAQIPL